MTLRAILSPDEQERLDKMLSILNLKGQEEKLLLGDPKDTNPRLAHKDFFPSIIGYFDPNFSFFYTANPNWQPQHEHEDYPLKNQWWPQWGYVENKWEMGDEGRPDLKWDGKKWFKEMQAKYGRRK